MTRAELRKLAHAIRAMKSATTSLREVLQAHPRYPDQLALEYHRAQASVRELERREQAERDALHEPHRFIRPARTPELLARWCVRCGFTRADLELHPPELQQESNNGAARAAAGGS